MLILVIGFRFHVASSIGLEYFTNFGHAICSWCYKPLSAALCFIICCTKGHLILVQIDKTSPSRIKGTSYIQMHFTHNGTYWSTIVATLSKSNEKVKITHILSDEELLLSL